MKKASKISMNVEDPGLLFDLALTMLNSESFPLLAFWEGWEVMRYLADIGYPEAQNEVGFIYERGIGVAQDLGQAFNLYQLAANQELAIAQFNLGILYARGIGVTPDYQEALKWLLLASDQGLAIAQTVLVSLYENGLGGLRDHGEAVTRSRLASEQVNTLALSDMCRKTAN